MSILTAILVDGGFYLKRAEYLWGEKTPEARAEELSRYCHGHLKDGAQLYRIFYYDCPPSEKKVFHPLLKTAQDLKRTPTYRWMTEFHKALATKRKVALRLGRLSENQINYTLKPEAVKKLLNSTLTVDQLTPSDFILNLPQKGVDMRIGLDISSMAFKKQATQMILMAGDSDFVPAAKQARREGVDFILDPMRSSTVNADLYLHIDGVRASLFKPDSVRALSPIK